MWNCSKQALMALCVLTAQLLIMSQIVVALNGFETHLKVLLLGCLLADISF
jgi:hypothetical protein